MKLDDVLEVIDVNDRMAVLVGLDNFKGHNVIDIRQAVKPTKGNGFILSPKGIAIRPHNLTALIATLQKARDEAGKRGWLAA
jgi:hypothetical protein